MPLTRITSIFQLSTVPSNLAAARVHVGGWSESFWSTEDKSTFEPFFTLQQNKRRLLMPNTAAIVGFRYQQYTISGNKLLPGGSSTGRQNGVGQSALDCDLPQVALQISCSAAAAANQSRMVLRGMPDSIMVGGEFNGDPTFRGYLTQFFNSMVGTHFGFIGRDLAQASVRVLKIAANVITVDVIPATGLQQGDFVRLHRVRDVNDNPVIGTFRVNLVNGMTITVDDLAATVNAPSGTLRRDRIAFYNYGAMAVARAVVKKVGRPFEQYRGRRSKTPA